MVANKSAHRKVPAWEVEGLGFRNARDLANGIRRTPSKQRSRVVRKGRPGERQFQLVIQTC